MTQLSDHIIQQADRMIADYPDAMIGVFSQSGHYLLVSPSHETILGYKPTELLGKRLASIVAVEDQDHLILARHDTIVAEASVEIGLRLIKLSGDSVRVRAQAWIIEDPTTGEKYLLGRSTPTADQPAGQS